MVGGTSKVDDDRSVAFVIRECPCILSDTPSLKVCYTGRNNNFIANRLASFGYVKKVCKEWVNHLPKFYC